MEVNPSGEPLGTENENCGSTRFSRAKRNFGKNHISYAHLTFKDVGGPFILYWFFSNTRLMGQGQNPFFDFLVRSKKNMFCEGTITLYAHISV